MPGTPLVLKPCYKVLGVQLMVIEQLARGSKLHECMGVEEKEDVMEEIKREVGEHGEVFGVDAIQRKFS